MTSIPSNLSRVPNMLTARITLGSLTSANSQLLRLQSQLATLQRVNRPSDDPVAASLVNVLDQELEHSEQRGRNISNAKSLLGVLDQRIGSINDMVLESKSIASGELSGASNAETRASQATVIDAMINELFSVMNDDFVGLSLFAGGMVGSPAMETFSGGYRYIGDRDGFHTDIGEALDFPLTLAADEVVGSFSSRVQGSIDLNPVLTPETKLSDLRGPMTGVEEMGSLSVTLNGTTTIQIDLSGAETVGDALDILESGIRNAPGPPVLQFAYPNGIEIDPATGNRIRLNIAGISTVSFSNGASGTVAKALGLDGVTYSIGVGTDFGANVDLDPRVTDRTTIGSMNPGVALDVGSDLVVRNGGKIGTVTVTGGMTVGELREAVRRLDLGVRVELNGSGDGIDFVNEVAGARMSIEEGGGTIATTLGVRSMMATTSLSQFNDGRGVAIADGNLDELGAPDPNRNVDFEVALSDGTTFTVDLVPADLADVATLLGKINAEAAASGLTIGGGAGEFQAVMDAGGNYLVMEDQIGGASPIRVTSLNGFAAEDLGFLDGAAVTGTPATLTGSDRTSVRVESLFTTLLDLRAGLEGDDARGITFAGEKLEADLDRLNRARALVGGRAQRVDEGARRLEDKAVLDRSIKSNLQDLDFFEASSRLTLLQTQLQASVQMAARNVPLTLLNFL